MCNLYSLTKSREAIAKLFRVSHNRAAAFEPVPAIFPGHAAPVIRPTADGERELVIMSWGFVLPQPGKAPRRVTNMRDDKVSTGFWRDSFETRRCLVPATSFAEPREVKPATWHWFALKGAEARPAFAFAGVWRRWRGPIKKDGPVVDLDTYSFMTTLPNALVATINHERMPVLLTSEAAQAQWLSAAPDEAFALAAPHDPQAMHIVKEGFEKLDAGEGGEAVALRQSQPRLI
jgi:putative SOS response-associated peptidase YedK